MRISNKIIKKELQKVLKECERVSGGMLPEADLITEIRGYLEKEEDVPDGILERLALEIYTSAPDGSSFNALKRPKKKTSQKEAVATAYWLTLHILNRCVEEPSITHLAVYLTTEFFDEEIGTDIGPWVKLKYLDPAESL